MKHNPLMAIDFYKVDHRRQYPEGTTEIYSNFTPRYVAGNHNLLPDFDDKIVVFGIQSMLIELKNFWDEDFFKQPIDCVIKEYKVLVEKSLNINDFDCSHLEALHNLGYLPIRIRAIEEGCRVPIGIPVLTIVNTHPDFFWLTNYLETYLSANLWKPMTSATIAFEFKRLLTKFAIQTGVDKSFVLYQAHDFSFRGMSGFHDAAISGAAHLTSFVGTDCVSAIHLLNDQYFAYIESIVGSSVPATEHSVMCCSGLEGEFETIKRLITEIYPTGIVSIVSDSYDLWQVLTSFLPNLSEEINNREGKLVIRPDSGNPVDIICGDICAPLESPSYKGALQLLWETFGGNINEKGFKVLNPKVGLIYGDSITAKRAELILQIMEDKGFASSNIVFGVGSYSYQYVTRDTFGFAMKATSAVINGERKTIFKDPKTGSSKKSAKGLLKVYRTIEQKEFELIEEVSEEEEKEGYLFPVFENGEILYTVDIRMIRVNIDNELEDIIEKDLGLQKYLKMKIISS